MDIVKSAHRYETWLRAQRDGDFDEDDLAEKHQKMADGAFQHLRATYWRWAETILDICPALKNGPDVLAVGDIHVENFGTWRDAEGRLVWGVNDFDEAARMPYAIDLVRLAASAVLAVAQIKLKGVTPDLICARILQGYRDGMEAETPKPFVLDRDRHPDINTMRNLFVVTDKEREKFWKKLDAAKIAAAMEEFRKGGERPKVRPAEKLPARHEKVLNRARPDSRVDFTVYARTAGTGSLGRPRFVGVGEWQGEWIVRETKAMVPSGWVLAHHGSHNLRCEEIATGRFRSPDRSYQLRGHVLVRRLSPNDFKIELKEEDKKSDKNKDAKKPKGKQKKPAADQQQDNHKTIAPEELLSGDRLKSMGYDLAAIHRGTRHRRSAILHDLAAQPEGWLAKAVDAAAKQVIADFGAWSAYWKDKGKKPRKKPKSRSGS
jgi:uncharacterized protein (DUF2252 family)